MPVLSNRTLLYFELVSVDDFVNLRDGHNTATLTLYNAFLVLDL
jgi:hypothetical protein